MDEIQSVWFKLEAFNKLFSLPNDGDNLFYDNCFKLSRIDPSGHKLFVLCREGCGLQHAHTIIGDGRVGVEIKSTSKGQFAVIPAFLFTF